MTYLPSRADARNPSAIDTVYDLLAIAKFPPTAIRHNLERLLDRRGLRALQADAIRELAETLEADRAFALRLNGQR